MPSPMDYETTTAANVQGAALMTRIRRRWPALAVVLALLSLFAVPVSAQLMVHPTRIVLEQNQRSAQMEIINNSDEAATYLITLVNRRMDEHGGFSEVDEPAAGELFADPMLRYSPRRVRLAPGAGQVIRIMARKPAALAPGEYRSHLLFAQQPDPAGAGDAGITDAGQTEEIGVALTALIGVSIPVIVRHGETAAEVSLTDLALQRAVAGQSPVLSLDMQRSGNRSVYGDLTVSFAPTGGAAQVVGRAGGVAVYTPNAVRRVGLVLDPPHGLVLADGVLTVRYRERPEQGGALLAEASLRLP